MQRDRLQTTYVGPPTAGYPPFDSVTHIFSYSTPRNVLLLATPVSISFGTEAQPALLDTLGEFYTTEAPYVSEFRPRSSGWYNFGGSVRFFGTSLPQQGLYGFSIEKGFPQPNFTLARFLEGAPQTNTYAVTIEFFISLYIESGSIIYFRAWALGSGTKYFFGNVNPAPVIFIHRML